MTASQSLFRELTDEEVAEYQALGWVKLRSFISPGTAERLFERLTDIMGISAENAAHPGEGRGGGKEDRWHTYAPLSVDAATGKNVDDIFYAVSHSPELGARLRQLSGMDVRYGVDQSLVKRPKGQSGSGSTYWHQDAGAENNSPFEPSFGQMQIWIALRKVTPAHGTMRFVSPDKISEKVWKIVRENSVEESYPLLEAEGVISEPYTLEIGDATIHGSEAMHWAPPNMEQEPRWAYVISVFPADRRWTGNYWWVSEKADGMVAGELFPDARFPILSQPTIMR